jgi:molybdate transport system permease protein
MELGKIGFPIYLSLKIAIVATILVVCIGLVVSWWMARREFPGKRIVQVLVNLPLVIPPTVLGFYLLLVFGRRGWIGHGLETVFGFRLVFHWSGGVLASVVVALPLFINTVRPAMAALDREVELAAQVDGATPFQVFSRITLPLVSKSLVAGTALSFARALGEFGATLMIIGNIPGKTQTISIAIYQAVLAGEYGVANQLVLLMTFIAVSIMLLIGKIESRE